MMRLREWYGWHFPEMSKIVTDNLVYAKAVRVIGKNILKINLKKKKNIIILILIFLI